MRAIAFGAALPMNRANLRCLGLSVGIAIALSGCRNPQRDFDDSVNARLHLQIQIDEGLVKLIRMDERRIGELEARQGHPPNGGDVKQARGASLSGTTRQGDAQ